MPTYKDLGIVLNSYKLGEADKILNIYTKENGLVRAVGKGIRKPKSKLSGRVDQLSCCHFQFAKGRNLDVISECEQINSFPRLRKNLKLLTYAILFLEIVSSFAHEKESESNEVYNLLYKSLDELQSVNNIEQFAIGFILHFLKIHGFKPQFNSCVSCNSQIQDSDKNIPFSTILGGIICNECANTIQNKMVNSKVISLLKYPMPSTQSLLRFEDIQQTLDILQEYINVRGKRKVRAFDLVFSL